MEQNEIVLINRSGMQLHINFNGVFPQNKWARNNGKVYLTEKEWEWCQFNIPQSLENGLWVLEGSEEASKIQNESDLEKEFAEFFAQNVNKAKSQVKKLEDSKRIDALLDYANDNEIDNKIVDALIERANELGE